MDIYVTATDAASMSNEFLKLDNIALVGDGNRSVALEF